VAAGAEFAVTRPVFDVETFQRLHARLAGFGIPIVAGVWPLESLVDAEFMANEVPGVSVPPHVLARMRAAVDGEAAIREGVAIARQVAVGVKGMAAGVHVAAPGGRVEQALAVLEGLA
jgi:homocysteine S-methyltransferase